MQKHITWEDVLQEGILRFTRRVLEKAEVKNCKTYFYAICRNYCLELSRKSKIPDLPEEDNENKDEKLEEIKIYLQLLSEQCKVLLTLLFYHNPPYEKKDKEKLSEKLGEHGYEVKTGSVSTIISRCLKNWTKIAKESLKQNT